MLKFKAILSLPHRFIDDDIRADNIRDTHTHAHKKNVILN